MKNYDSSPTNDDVEQSNRPLLKTNNRAEYEKEKLQAQQNKYLSQMWKKVESGLFQQSINYETIIKLNST
jgi:hypothetical protein